MTSESLPTPDGSIITRSGVYFVRTSFKERPKSPTKEQQMHPEFISRISMPESFKNPPSIPISPNSFSIRTTFSPAIASFRSFFINVVFPAPRKPEIISIFVIMTPLSCHCAAFLYFYLSALILYCIQTRSTAALSFSLPITNFNTFSNKVKYCRFQWAPGKRQKYEKFSHVILFSRTVFRIWQNPASLSARDYASADILLFFPYLDCFTS